MSVSFYKKPKCAACDKFCHKVSGQKKKIETEEKMRSIIVTIFNDFLCGKCKILHYEKEKLDAENKMDDLKQTFNDPLVNIRLKTEVDRLNDERIEVLVQKTVSTHKYCCVCSSSNETTVIPEIARLQSFIKIGIYVPASNRCCRIPLIKSRFYEECLSRLKVYSNSSKLTSLELTKMTGNLSIQCNSTLYDKIGDFSLSEKQLFIFTSLTWESIIQLRDMLTSMRKRSSSHSSHL